MEQIRKALSLNDCRLKFAGDGKKGRFEGYASKFNGDDSYGDTILPGAYADTLARHATPKMFINHRSYELPTGKWLTLAEDSEGLIVEGELTIGMRQADDLALAMQHGTVDGMSIGFMLSRDDYDWKDGMSGRIIKCVTQLVEISVVTFPADDAARTSDLKSALDSLATIADFEGFLRESGHFTKGMSGLLVKRAEEIFGRAAPAPSEGKAAIEVAKLFEAYKFPAGFGQ